MSLKAKFSKCELGKLLRVNELTQKDLSDVLGITSQQVQKYCSGVNEMPLTGLFKTCKKLNCSPEDIYPEIEMYYRGYTVPATSSVASLDYSEEELQNLKTTPNKTTHHNTHNTYNQTHNYYGFTSAISNFLFNVKVLDIDSKGSLLVKICLFVLAFYLLGFYTWRALGFHGEYIGQLLMSLHMFDICLAIVAPLMIRHFLMYIFVFATFRLFMDEVYRLITIGVRYENSVLSPYEWWIIAGISLVLTFIYAFIVNKYLRKSSDKKV